MTPAPTARATSRMGAAFTATPATPRAGTPAWSANSASSAGIGVHGLASASTGQPVGVFGEVNASDGYAVYGYNNATRAWGYLGGGGGWGAYGTNGDRTAAGVLGSLDAGVLGLGGTGVKAGQFNGDVGIDGDLVVTGTISPPSSRALKKDFGVVDSQALLEKLGSLPISSWVYRSDTSKFLFMGPMAEASGPPRVWARAKNTSPPHRRRRRRAGGRARPLSHAAGQGRRDRGAGGARRRTRAGPGRATMRGRSAILVLASVGVTIGLALSACSAPSAGAPTASPKLDCERGGYACTLGEVGDAVFARGDALLLELATKLRNGASLGDLVQAALAQPDVVEARVDQQGTAMYFLIDGGTPRFVHDLAGPGTASWVVEPTTTPTSSARGGAIPRPSSRRNAATNTTARSGRPPWSSLRTPGTSGPTIRHLESWTGSTTPTTTAPPGPGSRCRPGRVSATSPTPAKETSTSPSRISWMKTTTSSSSAPTAPRLGARGPSTASARAASSSA